jgi:hypothetical protein
VAGFFVAILFFFRVLQVQTQVQESLDYASRKTACEASLVSSESGLSGSAEVFFRKELNSYTLPASCIKGGTAGISLRSSSSSDVYVTLQAVYRVKLPIPFFHLQGIAVTQNSKSHKWTGDRGDLAEDTYVYVTENGTVYHRSRDCSYLDLSIQSVQAADLAGLRNKNAHKYNACKDCVAKNAASGVVYITDYGTCYHIRVSCSGLKRTIYLIPLSEVGTKGACSKCGGTKSKN